MHRECRHAIRPRREDLGDHGSTTATADIAFPAATYGTLFDGTLVVLRIVHQISRTVLFASRTAGRESRISATKQGGVVVGATVPHGLRLASYTSLPFRSRCLRRIRESVVEDAHLAVRINLIYRPVHASDYIDGYSRSHRCSRAECVL